MNTYNENLHSTLMTSLQGLQLTQKKMKSKLDASMFTLYYTQGARITAGEKLDAANDKYIYQQNVKEQAVNNSNISINLLTAANQQKKYTSQSVTNTSVCAANVQLAAKAVVRLAGDIGSIYNILSAADFHDEIWRVAKEANELMSKTAYDAEKVSQTAMEASTLTSEVSASTVADEAKTAGESIAKLLKVTSADFDTISATVAADNAALASASAIEKKAEGVLEFINVEYFAVNTSYQINNRELNQNLTVIPQNLDIVPEDEREDDSYVVSFDYYKSPFTQKQTRLGDEDDDSIEPLNTAGYPVKNYYIMLVKDNKKSTFSISNAEVLLTNSDQYVIVPNVPMLGQKKATQKIFISELKDSDNERMELGEKYVVFVLTELTEKYKKGINNFDDYLSAPSAMFILTNTLYSPPPDELSITTPGDGSQLVKAPAPEYYLEFWPPEENQNYAVEYRCMFLPDNTDLIKGLLSEKGLRTIEREVQKLESIANTFDPLISEEEAQINSLTSTFDGLVGQLTALIENKKGSKEEKENRKEEIAKIETEMSGVEKEISKLGKSLKKNKASQKAAMRALEPAKASKPGFFFNLKLAEQVSPANYTIAHDHKKTPEMDGVHKRAAIDETTTDNFGNLLVRGKAYIPVVLTVSKALEENLDQFTNSLTEYESTAPWIFPENN